MIAEFNLHHGILGRERAIEVFENTTWAGVDFSWANY